MAERKALVVAFNNSDRDFFHKYPDRHAHIRLPFADECAGEFWSLGDHQRARRRILLWRVPKQSPYYDAVHRPLLKIPFLAFADETIEDTDETLLPIIEGIMSEQLTAMGGRA